MNTTLSIPDFRLGKEYEELTSSKKYRYRTLKHVTVDFENPIIPRGTKMLFKDNTGKVWMTLTPYHVTISENYTWDGCSPKLKVFGKWLGTPDFPETALASLVHDAFYQFESTENFPLDREVRDRIFYNILEQAGFEWRLLYTIGANFGSTFFRYKKNKNVFSVTVD